MKPLWTAPDLLAATGGAFTGAPFPVTGIAIDSRHLRRGDLFVALAGEGRDGHDFVAAALAAGAAGALVARDIGLPGANLLLVPDTLAALRAMGAFARARFGGRLVAVTGSVGKTTSKEMLRVALAPSGSVHAADASHNNHIGVPLTLARLPAATDFCVIEIGMNHAGEIAPLAILARPHVAIITAIGATHIGHLGSLAAIAAEKASIMAGLEPGGTAILPTAPASLADALPPGAQLVRFGDDAAADARLLALGMDATGSDIRAMVAGREIGFRLGAPGRHLATNALAVLAACAALGADLDAAAAALAGFGALAGRGAQRPILGGSAVLIDESYNASPLSMRAALALLALVPAKRRIAVLGDMLELGEQSESEHGSLASDAALAADLVFACGPRMRHLFAALPPGRRGAHADTSDALAPLVRAALVAGDAVLVKGSLGSRMRVVVAALETDSP